MNFLISQNGGGEYVVIDRRTNQVRYRGSLDGARQAQAQLTCGQIANSSASKYCERWTANQNCKKGHAMKQCPQCGCDTPELHEGYCEDCCRENQAALDQHNAAFDDWQRLTPEQRDARIKAAMR